MFAVRKNSELYEEAIVNKLRFERAKINKDRIWV